MADVETSRVARAIAAAKSVLLAAALIAVPSLAAPPAKPFRPDLADQAAGSFFGDVISDARGSSRSGVRITVTKIGPNKVKVAADYKRLPPFTATLTRAMHTIQNSDGAAVFLLDLSKSPQGLDLTVDDASWSGTRE
jgi:hypothetical protein